MGIGMMLKSICLVRQNNLNDDAVAVANCKLGEAKLNNSKTSDDMTECMTQSRESLKQPYVSYKMT